MIARNYLTPEEFGDIKTDRARKELDSLNFQRNWEVYVNSCERRKLIFSKTSVLGFGLAAILGIVLEDASVVESLKYFLTGMIFMGSGIRSCHSLSKEIGNREEKIIGYDNKVHSLLNELEKF